MRRLLFLIVAGLLCGSVLAQKIRGRVSDAHGKPLAYATVFVESLNQSAVCDEKGRYVLGDVKKGRYDVKASFIGHKTQNVPVTVDDEGAVADFTMPEEVLSLTEVIVLPGGTDMCTYIMTQVDKNRKPLKKLLSRYDCFVTSKMHKDMDMSNIPHRRTARFAMSLLGWGKIFDLLVKYKELSVTMGENVHFNKGKISNDKLQVMATSPKLSSEEINVIKKKDWFLDSNSYDKFYDMVHSAIKKLKKKDSEDKLTYRGSYEEGRHTIFILKYGKTQVEVVDKCWQIRRLKYKDEKGNMYFEFYEASPGVFLPISCNADMQVSSQEKNLEGNIKLRMAYKYSNVSK